MRLGTAISVTCLLVLVGFSPVAAAENPVKQRAIAAVEAQQSSLIGLADQLWHFAEPALRETKSAAALAQYAEEQGFAVERGVAGMPTAFVATWGEGGPVIAILGEYDALPGLSQKAQPEQEVLVEGAAGHGCGHNLFGPASLGAAVAIKEALESAELQGTVRFYGTPAEEAIGGKLYMVREGLFEGVDVAFAWHPSSEISADTDSSQALVDFEVEFRGKTAHAAFDPWNGRSAADAAEVFTFALNLLREHVRPSVRMHYVVTDSGDVPNVVPAYARVWGWLRDSSHEGVDELLVRAREIVQGAALATGTEGSLRVQSGDWEMLANMRGAQLMHDNLAWLGPLRFSEEEHAFARRIQQETGAEPIGLVEDVSPLDLEPDPPQGGSTDVADVSWQVPMIHVSVTTAAKGAPWHAWPVVATGGMSIGHKGMIYAAKAIAATAVDLFQLSEVRAEIQDEFREAVAGVEYKGYIPDGPPPIPVD